MSRLITLFTVLSGCAIDGVYTGDCTLESGESKYVYEVEVDIDQEGEDIGGDALVLYPEDPMGGSYGKGEIQGSKDGDDVQMLLKFDEGALENANMTLDGGSYYITGETTAEVVDGLVYNDTSGECLAACHSECIANCSVAAIASVAEAWCVTPGEPIEYCAPPPECTRCLRAAR